jgi:hypothetical protein
MCDGEGKVLYSLTFTPMQALPFCSALLNCGFLDLRYLINLAEAYDLDPTELMLEAREFRL